MTNARSGREQQTPPATQRSQMRAPLIEEIGDRAELFNTCTPADDRATSSERAESVPSRPVNGSPGPACDVTPAYEGISAVAA